MIVQNAHSALHKSASVGVDLAHKDENGGVVRNGKRKPDDAGELP